MAKRLTLAELYEEKIAWRQTLYSKFSSLGFKLIGERRKFNPGITDGFSLLYPCKDPKKGLKVLAKAIAFLEKKGMKPGVEDEFDMNPQYVTKNFYVAVSLIRTGVYFYFEERRVELDFETPKSPSSDNLLQSFKPERIRARSG